MKLVPMYVVKNENGATLGGYTSYRKAKECRDIWQERYIQCGLSVKVNIAEGKTYVS